jgi:hypothetical protein
MFSSVGAQSHPSPQLPSLRVRIGWMQQRAARVVSRSGAWRSPSSPGFPPKRSAPGRDRHRPRLGKNFLTILQHWSGAVMYPAC